MSGGISGTWALGNRMPSKVVAPICPGGEYSPRLEKIVTSSRRGTTIGGSRRAIKRALGREESTSMRFSTEGSGSSQSITYSSSPNILSSLEFKM